jgi:TonB family protein
MQQQNNLFEGAFLVQPSLVKRLLGEVLEASSEFRADPQGYIRSAIKGDGLGGKRRASLLKLGWAIALSIFAVAGVFVVAWPLLQPFFHPKAQASDDLAMIHMVNPDDFKPQDMPEVAKQAKKSGGGGGGGRNTPTPPSKGQLPQFDLHPPIIAPRPEPQLRPPSIAVPETVQVDPRLQAKRDDLLPTGLPNGVPGPPSAGPGSGGGMGSGSGGGMGSGDGTGVGPGHGYNMGGGNPRLGGGTGNPGIATNVDTKPVPLNNPRPNYTEDARKNKVQGTVRVRVLVGADGSVKQVKVLSGLPDGLNEEAIRAAYQIRSHAVLSDPDKRPASAPD